MNFVIQSSVVIIPAMIGWIIATSLLLYCRRVEWTLLRHIVLTGFVMYLLLLIHLTVFPIHVRTGVAKQTAHFRDAVNIIPFESLRPLDFILNIAMTIPLGLLLPIVFRRSFNPWQIAAIAIVVGSAFEGNQYFMRLTLANDRYVDINDIIANTSGVICGFMLFHLAKQDRTLRHWAIANLLR